MDTILHFGMMPPDYHGGSARHIDALTSELASSHAIRILAPARRGPTRRVDLPDGRLVTFVRSPSVPFIQGIAYAIGASRIAPSVAGDARIVHAHNPYAIFTRRRLPSAHSVVTVHGYVSVEMPGLGRDLAASARNRILQRLEKRSLEEADRVIAVDSLLAAWIARRYRLRNPPIVLPNAVATSAFADIRDEDRKEERRRLGMDDEHFVIACTSHFHPFRRIDLAIEALPHLHSRVPLAKLILAGDGPDRPRLEALARARGVESSVIFLGEIPMTRVRHLLAASDIVFNSFAPPPEAWQTVAPRSLREAFATGHPISTSLSSLETLAAGKPLIMLSTDVRDPDPPSEAGAVVPPDARAIADAFAEFAGDAKKLDAAVSAGRALVSRRTWSNYADAVRRVYDELAS